MATLFPAARASRLGYQRNFRPISEKLLVSLIVVGPLIATIFAAWTLWETMVTWTDIWLLVGFYFLAALGITVGFHRFLTHNSFGTNRLFKILLTIAGCTAFEGGPMTWVANHRIHHAKADEDGDPHSPVLDKSMIKGLYHAHMGWMISGYEADREVWAKDLMKDKDLVLINRLVILFQICSLIIPFLVGGWMGLLWGGFVRIFLTHHITWSVNSVCHLYGSKPFGTKDNSKNNWIVGLLGMGEGAHNTHHASPRSARHGIYWWHFDLSYILIRSMEKLKLVNEVYKLDTNDLQYALKTGATGIKVYTTRK